MTFKDVNGRSKVVKAAWKYRVDWDRTCRSKLKKRVKDLLKECWEYDLVYEEFPVAGTRLTIDIYNASRKIAVETQGRAHTSFNKHFHNNSKQNFLHQIKRDFHKVQFCEINNIRLVEIFEGEKLDRALLERLELI